MIIKCKVAKDDYVKVYRHENGLVQVSSEGYPLLNIPKLKLLIRALKANIPEDQRNGL